SAVAGFVVDSVDTTGEIIVSQIQSAPSTRLTSANWSDVKLRSKVAASVVAPVASQTIPRSNTEHFLYAVMAAAAFRTRAAEGKSGLSFLSTASWSPTFPLSRTAFIA